MWLRLCSQYLRMTSTPLQDLFANHTKGASSSDVQLRNRKVVLCGDEGTRLPWLFERTRRALLAIAMVVVVPARLVFWIRIFCIQNAGDVFIGAAIFLSALHDHVGWMGWLGWIGCAGLSSPTLLAVWAFLFPGALFPGLFLPLLFARCGKRPDQPTATKQRSEYV